MKTTFLKAWVIVFFLIVVSSYAGVWGDANSDKRVDLIEVTDALQAAADVKSSVTTPEIERMVLPANAFNLGAGVSWSSAGVQFPSGYKNSIKALITMPKDWNGVSDFALTIFFGVLPDPNASGYVDFFIRVAGYKVGEFMNDPGSISSSHGVQVHPDTPTGTYKLYKQDFAIPASRFSLDDDVFFIYSIQRGGSNETYNRTVTLHAVEISYEAN